MREIPDEAYWGAQTSRAIENYPISGERAHPELIRAYARIKKACAETNLEMGRLDAALFMFGFTVILALGLFPQWLLPAVAAAAAAFSRLPR